jgi:hypothetical protein
MAGPTPTDPRRAAAERIERGIERYGEGDLAGAEQAFQEALTLVPGHSRALRCLQWVRDLSSGRVGAGGELPWEAPQLTPTGARPVLPSLPATGPSLPRRTISSSTILGMAPLSSSSVAPSKRPSADEGDTITREFAMVPTGPNLPPLDVPELTDQQIADLIALDSLPTTRPGALPKVVPPPSAPANDAGYVMEIEAEPPSAAPRPSEKGTLAGIGLDEVLPPLGSAGEAPPLPRSPFRDLTPLPLDAGQLPVILVDRSKGLADDELATTMPTNPFIKGPSLRDAATLTGASLPQPPPPLDPIESALAAIEQGDVRAALDAVERLIEQHGGLDAASVRLNHRTIVRVYETAIGPLNHVPVHGVTTPNLDPRDAFLLSRLDGTITVDDLLDISGMGRLEALRVLARLVQRGVIVVK